MGVEAGEVGGVQTREDLNCVPRTACVPTDLSSIHATCQPLPSATPWAWDVSTAAHTWGQGQHRPWDSGPSEQGMPGPGTRHRGLQVGGTQLEEG